MHRHTPTLCLHLVIPLNKPAFTATAAIAIAVRAAWHWPILTVTTPTIANTIVYVAPTNLTFFARVTALLFSHAVRAVSYAACDLALPKANSTGTYHQSLGRPADHS